MVTHILLSFIAAFGGFTQALTGVGVITVALPFMVLLADMKTVIPMVTLLALSINIVLGLQLRKDMQWRVCFPLLIGAAPGIPAGVYILKTLPSSLLQTILGIVLVAYGFYALIRIPIKRDLSPIWSCVAGFAAGSFGGSIGASGPPIIIYTTLQSWSKNSMKATMIGFFLVTTFFTSCMHAFSGLITFEVLAMYAVCMPGLAFGGVFGALYYKYLQTENYKKIMLCMILVLGLILFWKGLFA